MSRDIDLIVIHCSATAPSVDIGAAAIRSWHVVDNGWSDIGYHYVIRRNGSIELGRDANTAGAHARGYNKTSLGVCMVGGVDEQLNPEDNFAPEQYKSLEVLVRGLQAKHDCTRVEGHGDLPGVAKACPSFDVQSWLASL